MLQRDKAWLSASAAGAGTAAAAAAGDPLKNWAFLARAAVIYVNKSMPMFARIIYQVQQGTEV